MFVVRSTELYARCAPSAEIAGCARNGEGVTIGTGSPRAFPLSSSIARRQRFIVPDRSLTKYTDFPSGAQIGFQSTGASLVSATGSPPVGVIVQMSVLTPLPRRLANAMRRWCGDQVG